MNLFEKATKEKWRFEHKGIISVEDLWDLSLEDLDKIFMKLKKAQKESEGESLLSTNNTEFTLLEDKINLIKHIVSEKLEEKNRAIREKEMKEERQKIMQILSSKRNESLNNLSIEELEAKLEELK